jgi:MFS family permease
MAASEFSARSIGVAVACGIGAVLSGSSIMANSASVFILPMTAEFHWDRSKLSALMLVGLMLAGVATPLIGRLIDRFGARPVVLIGVVTFSLGTMAVSLVDQSPVRAGLFFAIYGVTAPALGAVGFNKVLSEWFQTRRGIVLALVGTGGAVGAFLIPRITRFLIDHFGWRGAYVGLGILVLLVTLPVLAALFREPGRPHLKDTTAEGHRPLLPLLHGITAQEAYRTRTFWLIIGAVSANILVGIGLQFHVVPLLADRGMSFDQAVNVSSYFGLGQVAGQLTSGYLLDRFDSPRIVIPFFAASLLGLIVLDHGSGLPVIVIAGLLLRLGVGAEVSVAPYLLARYFGLKNFGQIYGMLYLVATIAAGAGIQGMSYCYDRTHSYVTALFISEALLAVGVVLVAMLPKYLYPTHTVAHAVAVDRPGLLPHREVA